MVRNVETWKEAWYNIKNMTRRFSAVKNNRLQAVHDDDLSALLISLGVYSKVLDGQCSCQFCQRVITFKNLGAIIPINGGIAFSCDSPSCLNSMAEAGETNDSQ